MGKRAPRDWFTTADAKKNQGGTSSSAPVSIPTVIKIPIRVDDERPPSPILPLSRKRKVTHAAGNPKVSTKGKGVEELVDPQADRSIPGGMWDPAFNLGHKIDFNFGLAEQKVIKKTSKQKMADNCLEFACQAVVVA